MNINPQAASLAQKDVQQAAMTQADIEAARKSEQHALEVQQMLSRLEERRIILDGILLQSRSALNGKKIYMLHQQAQPVPTQQTLNFDENTE